MKQRARLQALGVRSIWKLNSPPTGEYSQPELLVNEISSGSPQRDGGGRRGLRVPPARGANDLNRDPSLATMLLGEVAEVC